MKPPFHPSADDITVEGILYALSGPARVQIFAGIARSESAQVCAAFLGLGDRKVPKSTLSQRFRVLREAGLIRSERQGATRRSAAGINLGARMTIFLMVASKPLSRRRRFPALLAHRFRLQHEYRSRSHQECAG
jgi:DNA-binding transcriptional ArsR family regulator